MKRVWLKKQGVYGELVLMAEADIEETMALRRLVTESLENPRFYAASNRWHFENAMKHGFVLNCKVEGKVVASIHCLLENTDYSKDRFPSDANLWALCADYSDVFVHPKFRGNRLQHILGEELERRCKEAGKQYVLGTVDPDNVYSLTTFERDGYRRVAVLNKYEDLPRILMEKELKSS